MKTKTTNVSISYMLMGILFCVCLISSNLLETNIFNYFDYVYDKESDETDSTKDKGNIIQIIVYASNKKLRSTYKITYLE